MRPPPLSKGPCNSRNRLSKLEQVMRAGEGNRELGAGFNAVSQCALPTSRNGNGPHDHAGCCGHPCDSSPRRSDRQSRGGCLQYGPVLKIYRVAGYLPVRRFTKASKSMVGWSRAGRGSRSAVYPCNAHPNAKRGAAASAPPPRPVKCHARPSAGARVADSQ